MDNETERLQREAIEREHDLRRSRQNVTLIWGSVLFAVCVFLILAFLLPAYSRYQDIRNAQNQVQVNAIVIESTNQLIEVEKKKAEIKFQESIGIRRAQEEIAKTLTDQYLQHEAIEAQLRMAGSPNHTQIYIPSGSNGIPIVRTVN